MIMIKFRTGGCGKDLIEKVEIEKETERCIWLRGSRLNKHTEYHQYFDTWQDAHNYLLEKAKREVDNLGNRIHLAKGKLGNIKGLKPII